MTAAALFGTTSPQCWEAALSGQLLRQIVLADVCQVEELKLLSTAEKLGLLSLAEKALTSDPGVITSASIVPFLAAIGAWPIELYLC